MRIGQWFKSFLDEDYKKMVELDENSKKSDDFVDAISEMEISEIFEY